MTFAKVFKDSAASKKAWQSRQSNATRSHMLAQNKTGPKKGDTVDGLTYHGLDISGRQIWKDKNGTYKAPPQSKRAMKEDMGMTDVLKACAKPKEKAKKSASDLGSFEAAIGLKV